MHNFSKEKVIITAYCKILPNDYNIKGGITLRQLDEYATAVDVEIQELSPGLHGIHVHRDPVRDYDCDSTGPHYNPDGHDHGGVDCREKHVGDLGNM